MGDRRKGSCFAENRTGSQKGGNDNEKFYRQALKMRMGGKRGKGKMALSKAAGASLGSVRTVWSEITRRQPTRPTSR